MKTAHNITSRSVGAVLATAALATACTSPSVTYAPSTNNVLALREARQQVVLGAFSGGPKQVLCRLQGIEPEGGRGYASFIRNAFNDEIRLSGLATATKAGPRLELRVTEVAVSCGIIDGTWTIKGQVSIGATPSVEVSTTFRFDGNYVGYVVFERAQRALVPAVQKFLADVQAQPAFRSSYGLSAVVP